MESVGKAACQLCGKTTGIMAWDSESGQQFHLECAVRHHAEMRTAEAAISRYIRELRKERVTCSSH